MVIFLVLHEQTLKAFENTAQAYNARKYLSLKNDPVASKGLNWGEAQKVLDSRKNSTVLGKAYCGFSESCIAALYLMTHL